MNNLKEPLKYAAIILLILCAGVALLLPGITAYAGLFGLGVLSYTFGLRHAFDADHIAAIDNMTRKLLNQGKKNKAVGFFFSLGHSTVVMIMSAAVIFALEWAKDAMPRLAGMGGVVATLISGVFLLLLAAINSVILKRTIETFLKIKRGEIEDETPANEGRIQRFINKLFGVVNNYKHVYLMGFLFGLGFDTATQIGLIATSATASYTGIPWYIILSFPILFTAGMTMMDTIDGFLMSSAYNWAFSSPVKKGWFNITLTGMSVLVAGVIGIIEVLQVVAQKLNLTASFWNALQSMDFEKIGVIVLICFVAVWAVSFVIWKALRLDKGEA